MLDLLTHGQLNHQYTDMLIELHQNPSPKKVLEVAAPPQSLKKDGRLYKTPLSRGQTADEPLAQAGGF
jgi:hypothetical protein